MLNLEFLAGVDGILLLFLDLAILPFDVYLLLLFYFLFDLLRLQRFEARRGLGSRGLVRDFLHEAEAARCVVVGDVADGLLGVLWLLEQTRLQVGLHLTLCCLQPLLVVLELLLVLQN